MEFKEVKQKVRENFEQISMSQENLFYVDINREQIWEEYLNGFDDPEERQQHNCNCCKSFLRQYGGLVAIKDNKKVSIWDIDVDERYDKAISNISKYVHSLPVTDIFFNSFKSLGTDYNIVQTENGLVQWNHFHLVLDKRFVQSKSVSLDTVKGDYRANKDVLKRSLDELSIDATETVLELIAQNSLYRGKEFENNLKEFLKLQKEYNNIPEEQKDNFCWIKCSKINASISRIRNTSIGTLLINLSEGMDLDTAVTKFEQVVAPSNYKRPTALITSSMVEDAKKKLQEMGLLESLDRRFATETDLSVDDILYVDKSSQIKDVFKELSEDAPVNIKNLSKVEEVSIEDFVEKILPTTQEIKVFLENKHKGNFVSLLTSQVKDTKPLFKWNNNFSWSYTGGVTDSMKERVKAAGGNVNGVLRFSIQWNEDGKSIIDLDAHAIEPQPLGRHIYYSSGNVKAKGGTKTSMSGILDVDMINPSQVGVENIVWIDIDKMSDGEYTFFVHNFSGHKNFDGVRCEIEFAGEIHEFSTDKPFTGNWQVCTVVRKGNNFTVKGTSQGVSKGSVKWNLSTGRFHKVKNIMLSPNYWTNKVGNKHYMFILENCINDETPRPFYNEFLNEELAKNRKVLEVMGSKLKVVPSTNQLSGIGFSETQRNSLIVQVNGKFKRTVKINF